MTGSRRWPVARQAKTGEPFMMRDRREEARLFEYLLLSIARDEVPHRADRNQPRRKKPRPKEYTLLEKPRRWYRLHLDEGAR